MAGKPIGLLVAVLGYFFLYSTVGFVEQARNMTASPQWLLQIRSLPEQRISLDLGEAFMELQGAATSHKETVCISEKSYQDIVASRSAFVPYFIQTRRLSQRCDGETE